MKFSRLRSIFGLVGFAMLLGALGAKREIECRIEELQNKRILLGKKDKICCISGNL